MVLLQRRVFVPRLSFKITLPYAVLALALALAALYIVARMQANSIASAFNEQISDARLRVADSIVRTEQNQLAHVRTMARLAGLGQAVQSGDVQSIQSLLVPYLISQHIERAIIIDQQKQVLSGIQVAPTGAVSLNTNPAAAAWPFIEPVLQGVTDSLGNKYVALMDDQGEQVLYTATPIYMDDTIVGALLAGSTARTLVAHWRAESLTDMTLYDATGVPLATSFGADVPSAIDPGAQGSLLNRELTLGSREYTEVIASLVLRSSQSPQFIGVAIPNSGTSSLLQRTETLLLMIFGGGILLAILIGITIARRITRPITALVHAAEGVTAGNLNQELAVTSFDEIGSLTSSFNTMIAGLRERERMHDILGRFVSPTVAQLVLSRPLGLSGETKLLTILFTDLRDFTVMTEREDPAIVISGLNDYFRIVVDAADRYGGIVNKFGGDSTLVLFGLTDPHPDGTHSAVAAVRAGLEIRTGLHRLNVARAKQRLPLLIAGIGVNTGSVVAGLIGSERRMEYTAIGDAVNLSARIQALNRDLGTDILISESTHEALGEQPGLNLVDYGVHRLKGKSHGIRVYTITSWEIANEA